MEREVHLLHPVQSIELATEITTDPILMMETDVNHHHPHPTEVDHQIATMGLSGMNAAMDDLEDHQAGHDHLPSTVTILTTIEDHRHEAIEGAMEEQVAVRVLHHALTMIRATMPEMQDQGHLLVSTLI